MWTPPHFNYGDIITSLFACAILPSDAPLCWAASRYYGTTGSLVAMPMVVAILVWASRWTVRCNATPSKPSWRSLLLYIALIVLVVLVSDNLHRVVPANDVLMALSQRTQEYFSVSPLACLHAVLLVFRGLHAARGGCGSLCAEDFQEPLILPEQVDKMFRHACFFECDAMMIRALCLSHSADWMCATRAAGCSGYEWYSIHWEAVGYYGSRGAATFFICWALFWLHERKVVDFYLLGRVRAVTEQNHDWNNSENPPFSDLDRNSLSSRRLQRSAVLMSSISLSLFLFYTHALGLKTEVMPFLRPPLFFWLVLCAPFTPGMVRYKRVALSLFCIVVLIP